MVLSLWLSGAATASSACEEVGTVPDALQVAWVAPLGKRVRPGTRLEVVRVADLRASARAAGDPVRLLQSLGMLGRRPSLRKQERDWQVLVFDVRASWLCRPMDELEPGQQAAGVAVCELDDQGPVARHRKGFTGCGYSLDTAASTRGVDVFRTDWQTASSLGFCLLPLSRFMEGA